MATKKKSVSRTMDKKSMKKTKGGIMAVSYPVPTVGMAGPIPVCGMNEGIAIRKAGEKPLG